MDNWISIYKGYIISPARSAFVYYTFCAWRTNYLCFIDWAWRKSHGCKKWIQSSGIESTYNCTTANIATWLEKLQWFSSTTYVHTKWHQCTYVECVWM